MHTNVLCKYDGIHMLSIIRGLVMTYVQRYNIFNGEKFFAENKFPVNALKKRIKIWNIILWSASKATHIV